MSSQEGGSSGASGPDEEVSSVETDVDNNKKNPPEMVITVTQTDINLNDDEKKKLELLDKALEGDQQPKPKTKPLIQKVPSNFDVPDDFRKYFQPKVISIGPLHHDNETPPGSEQLKLQLAAHFVKNIEVQKEILYDKIKKEIGSLKECYDPKELERYDDEELAWMLFLDGCAILQAILQGYNIYESHYSLKKMIIKNDKLKFMYFDLFLLENQLPYRVLELLITSSVMKRDLFKEMIEGFIEENVITPATMRQKRMLPLWRKQQEGDQPVHLLDHLRKRFIDKEWRMLWGRLGIGRLCHLFCSRLNRRTKMEYHYPVFRKAKELRNAGIWFKESKTSRLWDVSFSSTFFMGKLRLPRITVDDSTWSKFMNLIAYEMCPDFDNDYTVTSYISFLDWLIDDAGDVNVLRDDGVLCNGLGSDEEVAKLFNKTNSLLVPRPEIYMVVRQQTLF